MRTVDELRRALIDQSRTAPEVVGLVEAAHTRAGELRRRRRMLIAAGAAALAAALAVAPVVVARVLPTPAVDDATTPHRWPLRLTVDVAPESGFFTLSAGVFGTRQQLTVRTRSLFTGEPPVGLGGGEVALFEPGAFDAAPFLRDGQLVAVQGHAAYFVADLPGGDGLRAPAIGWPEPSGAWVVVLPYPPDESGDVRGKLMLLADAVRIGPPRELLAPYRLGHVPNGYRPGHATASTVRFDGLTRTKSHLTLGTEPSHIDLAAWTVPDEDDEPMSITVLYDGQELQPPKYGPPTGRIAGRDVWYSAGPGARSVLRVRFGECDMVVSVADSTQVPYRELQKMIEKTRFADCADPTTWLSPLP